LKEKLVVAGDEAIQLFYNTLILHLILVVSKDTKLFKEVQDNEKEIRVVSLKHGK
jgi:hypothetical protein